MSVVHLISRTDWQPTGRILATGLLLIAVAACGPPSDRSAGRDSAGAEGLYLDPAAIDFSNNPELLDRIVADPHGYFRFINLPFSRRVCDLFSDRIRDASSELTRAFQLNLHGDAHVEQYAITDLGRGLTDFDDSSQGPPFLDLMRFAVSLRLASRMNGWDELTEEGHVRIFLRGYRSALADPETAAPEPTVVSRLRSTFSDEPGDYLTWVDSLMGPVPEDVEASLRAALAGFADDMVQRHPEVRSGYFDPVSLGYFGLGVGSALDTKFLVRVRGPSDDPFDDDVIEIKQVRDLSGIDCIQTKQDDPLRILLSQARIAYEPFRWLHYVRIGESNFWTHGWVRNYAEMDVDETFAAPGELAEIAYDAGVQLGLGHPNQAAAPFDEILREQTLEQLDNHPGEIERLSRELADEVYVAWERFAAQARRAR